MSNAGKNCGFLFICPQFTNLKWLNMKLLLILSYQWLLYVKALYFFRAIANPKILDYEMGNCHVVD